MKLTTVQSCRAPVLYGEELRLLVADIMSNHAAVVVAPLKARAVSQTHDGALAFLHPTGLAVTPGGAVDAVPVHPEPLPVQRAAPHADPHLLYSVVS